MSKMPEYCALSNIKSKIKAEEEKKLRGLSFAKLFFTEKNYDKALTYVNEYLSVKENSSFAYKLLGDIYEALDDNDKAFESYKKSYMIDKSQDNLLFKICEKLTLINADNKTIKSWLQLLEKKFPKHQAVFYLKEKLSSSENNELMASPFLDVAPIDTSIANLTNLTNLTNFTSVTNYTNKDDLKNIERNQDRLFKKLVDFETDIHKKIDSIKDDILKENQNLFDNFKTEIDKVSSSLVKLQIGQQELKQVLEDLEKNNYDKDYELDDEDDEYDEEDEEDEKIDLSFNNKNVNMLENSKGIFSRLGPVPNLNNQTNSASNPASFPDKFLPAKDSWECSACYLRNQSSDTICKSCETPKAGSTQQPKQPVVENKNEKSAFSSFFKDPTKMPWDCKSCSFKNSQDLTKCSSCNAAKPVSGFLASATVNNNVAPNTNSSFNNNSSFSFNFAQSKPNESSKFVFGNTAVGNTSFNSTISNNSFNIGKSATSNTSFNLDKSPAPKTPISTINPPANNTSFNLNNSPVSIPSFNLNQPQTNVPFNLNNLSSANSPLSVNQPIANQPFNVNNQPTINQPFSVSNQVTSSQPFGVINQNKNNSVFQIGNNPTPSNEPFNMNSVFMPNVNLPSFNLQSNSIFDKTNLNQASFVFGKSNVTTDLGSANTNEIFKPMTETNSKISFNFTLKDTTSEKPVTSLETSNKIDQNDNAESYEPQVEFVPVIPLPPKIEVVTGEENEKILFVNRAKLYRFTDNEWKERGKGEFKILFDEKNKKYRFLMRRDQVLKVCLNSPITSQFKFTQKNKNEENKKTETNILHWCGIDFSEESSKNELFAVKFKNKEIAENLKEKVLEIVDILSGNVKADNTDIEVIYEKKPKSAHDQKLAESLKLPINFFNYLEDNQNNCSGCNGCKEYIPKLFYETKQNLNELKDKPSSSDNNKPTSFGDNLFSTAIAETKITTNWGLNTNEKPKWMESALAPIFSDDKNLNDPEAEANLNFKPVIPLPDLVSLVTGEEEEDVIFVQRSKLFKFINNEWKERGVGEFKFLKDKKTEKLRFLMRRDIVHKVCLNHSVDKNTFKIKFRHNSTNILQWSAKDFSEGFEEPSVFNLKFKNNDVANKFLEVLKLEGIELTV